MGAHTESAARTAQKKDGTTNEKRVDINTRTRIRYLAKETSRIQLAPHARLRAVPITESGWIPVLCVKDEVAKSGGTGITNAYTDDMLSRERTMDCIMHRSLGDNT